MIRDMCPNCYSSEFLINSKIKYREPTSEDESDYKNFQDLGSYDVKENKIPGLNSKKGIYIYFNTMP